MNTMTSPPPRGVPAVADHPLGDLLRQWRSARRMSQMDLALEAGISTRHLSYVETGKARPSRELVALLAGALDMPMRDRNALLVVAGYAPGYRETALSDPQMALMRRAIEFILAQQEPYPAFVVNRHWDVLMANKGLLRVFDWLRDGVQPHGNIMRQVFDPADMRPFVENWEEVAGDLIRHLHHEAATDRTSRALLDEVLAYPDVPARWERRELGATPLPLMTVTFRKGDQRLTFFSTLTTFGTSRDITLEELRVECMFPADDETAAFCKGLAEKIA
ncbi:helix-turn-helix transcriptional regulator [Caulobacter sp. BE254]|uniref:helix-turn-helix domain-containing protein n=1 Tax=Caulobacter sp. BE254 TaxID=2817720 RepID=UPI00285B038B|nr:helix-turn-helix transcriptional regulator [Caulobacter sp. BE254]MDR7115090.1 transcriptional regulator with XRE-family HTH domain [Caulobacter sp. BE254]